MAYDPRGLTLLSRMSVVRFYDYQSDDSLAAIQADSYFDQLPRVERNDLISVNASDGAGQFRLTRDVVGLTKTLALDLVGAAGIGLLPNGQLALTLDGVFLTDDAGNFITITSEQLAAWVLAAGGTA